MLAIILGWNQISARSLALNALIIEFVPYGPYRKALQVLLNNVEAQTHVSNVVHSDAPRLQL